jgi:hypothetical protein
MLDDDDGDDNDYDGDIMIGIMMIISMSKVAAQSGVT